MKTPIEELSQGRSFECHGEGELRLQAGQAGPPEGPGRVRFDLRYAPSEDNELKIGLNLRGLDEGAAEILGWRPPGKGRDPLPRYDLSGTADGDGEERPVIMETVSFHHPLGLVREISQVGQNVPAHALTVTVGDAAGVPLDRARMLIPNLLAEAELETQGLRLRLIPVPDRKQPTVPAFFPTLGKVLPGSFLDLEKCGGSEGDVVGLAVEAFGWFLSFYAGRAVHPLAWEGETGTGRVWRLSARLGATRFPAEEPRTCIPYGSYLGRFLARAWESWLELSEVQRLRLRGVVNVYQEMLAAPFPIQRIALTAMFLERFRELVLGSSELLPTSEGFSPSKRKRVASEMRRALKEAIASSRHLNEAQKEELRRSLEANPGKVQDLFRKTFKESLLELYARADLEVDEDEVKEYITERDAVLHGSWVSDVEGGIRTFFLAEYGLGLLERLVLRFFGYEGLFYDRVQGNDGHLAKGEPTW